MVASGGQLLLVSCSLRPVGRVACLSKVSRGLVDPTDGIITRGLGYGNDRKMETEIHF